MNFSGEWSLNIEKSKLDEKGTMSLPVKMIITQNAKNLFIER